MSREALGSLTWLGSVFVLVAVAQGQIYYSNNFEDVSDPLSEWSSSSTGVTPGTLAHPVDTFLGPFASDDCVTLTLTGLSPHEGATLEFDLYAIESWEGNYEGQATGGVDTFRVRVLPDGAYFLHTTFSNMYWATQGKEFQSYPDDCIVEHPDRCVEASHPAQTGADEKNTLGYSWAGNPADSVYHLAYTFTHTDESLALEFCGQYLSAGSDESWGLDNVMVNAGGRIPTISEWGLVAMTLLVLGGGTLVLRRCRVSDIAG